jgi:hypothetical protein
MSHMIPMTPMSLLGSTESATSLSDANGQQETGNEDSILDLSGDPFSADPFQLATDTLTVATPAKTVTTTSPTCSAMPTPSAVQMVLHQAIVSGRESMVRLLIDHGADVMRTDGAGKTALHLAAECGSEGCMRAVLGTGQTADLNVPDYLGPTPIFSAVQAGNEAAARVLLEDPTEPSVQRTKVDINRKDGMGMTSLHLAVEGGFEAIAKLLLAHGAEIHDYA